MIDQNSQFGMQQEQLRQIEELKRSVLAECLTKEARERLSNVRIANPQLSEQVESYLIQVYQAGQIKEPISEEQLKDLLKTLTKKKEMKIVRK
ncbi:MAG: DNA-binding protein [Candidatus Aenigmarchaeota archaeon]|nr:DNA-binding protein [Candidatus Aenigmarchaeota archaeon]